MSAHIELDFADDGTVLMTCRHTKGNELVTEPFFPPPPGYDYAAVMVAGSADETITHILQLTAASWRIAR